MKNLARMMNHKFVRELFDYCPQTGDLVWKIAHGPSNRIPAGTVAGSLSRGTHLTVRIGGKNYYCHRLIWLWMTGAWPVEEIDHKNRDGCDNRWSNLRQARHGENQMNCGLRTDNTSGVKGVWWLQRQQRWEVRIGRRYVGKYKTFAPAKAAYQKASKDLYGEFARGD